MNGTALTSRLGGFVRLVRPLNVVMMALGVGIGAILAAGASIAVIPGLGSVVLAMIAATAIGSGANAVNDVFDREIDRVNRSDRPLPSGLISVTAAWWMWALLSAAGIGLALMISWLHAVIAVGSVALLYVYSAHLKRQPLSGNLVVALVIALALVFGGMVPLMYGVGSALPLVGGAVFAFATTLAREIAKDIEDMRGDAQVGARTLPLVAGSRAAGGAAAVIVVLTVAMLPAARVFGLGLDFLALSLPAAALLLAGCWWLLASTDGEQPARRAAARASGYLKGAMLAGLAALALATW